MHIINTATMCHPPIYIFSVSSGVRGVERGRERESNIKEFGQVNIDLEWEIGKTEHYHTSERMKQLKMVAII